MSSDLSSFLAKAAWPVMIVGVGNTERGDDGAGPSLISLITNKQFITMNSGSTPENYLVPIVSSGARTILIADAADLGEVPGTVSVCSPDTLHNTAVSTHAMSLGMMVDFITSQIPDITIMLLGIQPSTITNTDKLSPPVQKAVTALATTINEYQKT